MTDSHSPSPLAFIDLETTGLNTYYDNVIEIGVVLKGQERAWLIKIEGALSGFIRDLTKIHDEDLQRDGVPIRQALEEMMEFLYSEEKPILVGHNIIDFDRRFLLEELKDAGLTESYAKFKRLICIDTLYISRFLFPEGPHNLFKTCERLEVKTADAHRAIADCRMAQGVIEAVRSKFVVEDVIRSSMHSCCSDEYLDEMVWGVVDNK
jgi:DNA polymerase-3 subunit epsilon